MNPAIDPALIAQRRRVLAAGVCGLILTVGLGRFAYTPLLPLMREQAGLSHAAGGWLAAFNYLGYLSGALLAASISDVALKYRLYRWGLLLAIVSLPAMGLTDHFAIWALLRYLSGLGSTAGLLLASGLVLNWLIRHQLRAELGAHFAGLGLGVVVSGLAVGAMLPRLDWSTQWLVLGVLGLGFFLPAWRWMPAPQLAGTSSTPTVTPPSSRWMRYFMAAYFCAGVGYVVSATFIVAIVENHPALAGWGSGIWMLIGLAAVPSCFVWDRVTRELGQMPAILLAYAVQALAIALQAFSDGLWLNLLSALLYGVTFVGIVSLALSIVGRTLPANPAKAMARLTLSYGVAQIAAPALAGTLAQVTGSYRGALWVAAGMVGVGMGFLWAMWQCEQQERHAASPRG